MSHLHHGFIFLDGVLFFFPFSLRIDVKRFFFFFFFRNVASVVSVVSEINAEIFGIGIRTINNISSLYK